MFVKYDENNNITSLFIHCIPDDTTGYTEIPDDDAIVKAYIETNRVITPQPSAEERIAELEAALAALLEGETV